MDALDYTPIRKIKISKDSILSQIEKYRTGILKNNYYLLWIQNENFNNISPAFILSTYEDDLDIKNLTLKVKATNNSLKGNDEIKIESGDILAISTSGDGLKTSTTSLSKKGKQKGNINIEGGTLSVYSMCDAIDSACNVNISNDSVINLYTDSYSTYSDDSTSTQKEKLYIRGLYYENIQFFSFHPKQDEAHPGYGAADDGERRGE